LPPEPRLHRGAVEGAMGWLWESEREERPRRSGLRLPVLSGLASLAVAAGVFLVGGKGADHAGAPAAQLDCTSPRNTWRAACRLATAEASIPAVSETAEEAPKATGTLSPKMTARTVSAKTARASSKLVKPETAAPEGAQKPVEETSHIQPEEQPLPARTMAALDNPPKAELATPSSPEPRVVQKASLPSQAAPKRVERAPRREPATAERAPEEPAKLARHRAKRVAAVARAEPSRPAPQAMKPESRPARPRVRGTGEDFAGFRRPDAGTVALPDGRRAFVERSPREAFAVGRDAYRASQWKVTTYRDPIDW
jgi:hypothetical protein